MAEETQHKAPHQAAPVIESLDAVTALYDDLLSKCPVKHTEAAGSFYWLTKHQDVRAAAMDAERFSSERKGVLFPPNEVGPRIVVLETDPPEHLPRKRLYMDGVTRERIRAAEPRLLEIAHELIDKFCEAGECDLIKEFCQPYPVLGMCQTIGIGGPRVERIRELSSRFGTSMDRPTLFRELGGLVIEQVLERRVNPRDDYLTLVATTQFDGRVMDEVELANFLCGFLIAGHETTASALASLTLQVLSDPGLKERIVSGDAKVLSGAIEETVRLYSPFQAFHRTTTEPVEIEGVAIPEDATVRLGFGAANRDPSVFECPHQFNPDRKANAHLGFGSGRHLCIGSNLARAEMRIALTTLLNRLPDLRLASGGPQWNVIQSTITAPAPYRVAFTPTPRRNG